MKMQVNFDNVYDTLYVALADKNNSYGDESDDGLVVMRDIDTDLVTGFTIFNFWDRYSNDRLNKLSLPYNLEIKRDIIPLLHQ